MANSQNRVPTGVDGLDSLIEGGFPRDSIILVAGNPGAGKTILAAQFVFYGATVEGEKGLYVSFAETRESFLRSMLRFGWDFAELERQNKVSVLDLSTTKEPGIQGNLNLILEKLTDLGAKRLVIDSFTALSMALKESADVRFLIHLLYRFLQRIGCTTIVISDIPWSSRRIGWSVEEFITDGIILLRSRFDGGMLRRTCNILKMRCTNHSLMTHDYEITDLGIRVIPRSQPSKNSRGR
jgi:circadian clock protein KaiC